MRFVFFLLIPVFFFSSHAISQVIGKTDSLYVEIKEDSLKKKAILNSKINYKVRVYLFGFFDNDTVKIIRNNKVLYSNIISTKRENGNYDAMSYTDGRLNIDIRKRRNDVFRLLFNKHSIDLHFRYGYGDLTVDVANRHDKVLSRDICSFSLRYTNDFFITKF